VESDLERRIVEPPEGDAEARAALRCLLRLRGEGKPLGEIAAGLAAETGSTLPPEAVDRILRRVAGPAAGGEGADPEYFSGHLGGG
jgi:hypothetical protein